MWSWGSRGAPKPEPLSAAQKLKAYHDLAKEAVERAYAVDSDGRDAPRAIKLYKKGLEIIEEALTLHVPSSGLSAKADSVTNWRDQLSAWQNNVHNRVRVLESGTAGSRQATTLSRILALPPAAAAEYSSHPAGPRATQQRQQAAPQRQQQQQQAPSQQQRPRPAAASGTQPATAGGRDDERYRQLILGEILDHAPSVRFGDVADLVNAKQALREAVILPSLRSDIFSGLRAPVRGLLLYGPPGNGKTLLCRALAAEAAATFFAISASSLTSKWVGEGEKLVRALFALAAERAPSIIFIDEIDSILSARSAAEHDAARRLKTEFLVQFDGVASDPSARIVVIGATNRPQELDDAVRRRLVKRIYIPLPDAAGRAAILQHLLNGAGSKGSGVALSAADQAKLVRSTDGYSASDLTALAQEAAMGPVRELGAAIATAPLERIRAVRLQDFADALQVIRPSVSPDQLQVFDDFTRQFGTT